MSQDTTAMETVEAVAGTPDPDFIVYLLDPEQDYNCYFVVGNQGIIERIGVVKKMLLAHSVVLRAELQDSKIAEKNDVKVVDIFPQTFKNLLRFVYGFDNTQELEFDEADNLLYAAEKYMMPKLKNRLASRLMSLLNSSNICILMNNPACYSVLELNAAITEILQIETDQVLASPHFLDLSSEAFLKILEQEICNVPEIELWRAAISWAKKQAGTNNGKVLRKNISPHLQLIRVCTLTFQDMMLEVIPTKVLKYDEIVLVGESQRTKEVQPNLTTICNIVEERESPLIKSEIMYKTLNNSPKNWCSMRESTFKLRTTEFAIELCSVKLYSYNLSPHQCNCRILIEKDMEPPPWKDPWKDVHFEGQINQSSEWTVPIPVAESSNGEALRKTLSPHLKLIRICTLTYEDMMLEVMPSEVLSYREMVLVGESRRTGKVQQSLTTICNTLEKRDRPLIKSELMYRTLSTGHNHYGERISASKFTLRTQDVGIELCSVQLYMYDHSSLRSHHCICEILIEKKMEPPVIVRFEGRIDQTSDWTIPILVDEKNVKLAPNSSYSIKCTFSCSHAHYGMYLFDNSSDMFGTHFCIDLEPHSNGYGYYLFQITKIGYKTITKNVKYNKTRQ